jgi:hypothetical protein
MAVVVDLVRMLTHVKAGPAVELGKGASVAKALQDKEIMVEMVERAPTLGTQIKWVVAAVEQWELEVPEV